ncbi:MAG TPA: NADH-quinone oxidoreductase subunit L [Candidatus Dormibacteraeota bacterium]|jgi:NADH-quinone oxidoreductase subunit L|nr:NADH-quinone oxidoreductase subunit L [Candidatus Dormibacteraeota bacterium]
MTAIYSQLGLLWLIPLLPLLAFSLILGIFYDNKRTSAWIGIVGTGLAWVISLALMLAEMSHGEYHQLTHPFLSIGAFNVQLGVVADPLAGMMVVVVTSVSALVQIYSLEYMRGEEGFVRFYAFISLFTFSMLTLVLSTNFFQTYVGWELVGVCSYLLIGHYYKRPAAAAAAKKAFIVTRFGDFPFLVGVGYIWFRFGDFDFHNLAHLWGAGKVGTFGLFVMAMLVFSGAVGKSAQFPLHVWLPDAMEGPTPISALIHAATMVAAGVYLVARAYDLFAASPSALVVIATIGAVTSLMAAIWAVAQDDIKRVIAYSTLSHLGLMMFGLGVGAYSAAVFHLFVHAWFKAALFLCAGSVIHAVHSQDIWDMGGLRKKMPVTFWTFLIASLAAAGIPPLAGFWSKDGIIGGIFNYGNPFFILVAVLITFFSSLYTFRLLFVVFTGDMAKRRAFDPKRVHESKTAMTLPLVILAVPAALVGFANLPGAGRSFSTFVYYGAAEAEKANGVALLISIALALSGLLVAALFYYAPLRRYSAASFNARFAPVYDWAHNKGYFDEIYQAMLIDGLVLRAGQAVQWADSNIVDGFVDGLAEGYAWVGGLARKLQGGRVQGYAVGLFAGIIVLTALMLIFGSGGSFAAVARP